MLIILINISLLWFSETILKKGLTSLINETFFLLEKI